MKFFLVRSILKHVYFIKHRELNEQAESTTKVVDRLNLLGNASVGNVILVNSTLPRQSVFYFGKRDLRKMSIFHGITSFRRNADRLEAFSVTKFILAYEHSEWSAFYFTLFSRCASLR